MDPRTPYDGVGQAGDAGCCGRCRRPPRELGISESTARDNVVRNDEWQAGSNEPYGWLLVLDARIPVYIAAKNGAMKVKAHEARRAIGAA